MRPLAIGVLGLLAVAATAWAGQPPAKSQTAADPALVRSLIDSLGDPQPEHRAEAAKTLRLLRVSDKAVIKALIDTLDDLDHGVREEAVSALRSIGPDAKEAVPALIKLYRAHGAPEKDVLETLGVVGHDSKEALDALITIVRWAPKGPTRPLETGLVFDRKGQAMAPDSRAAVESHRARTRVRVVACEVLGNMGPDAAPAVPVLIDILQYAARSLDYHSEVYVTAANSLGKIGDPRALPVLQQYRRGEGIGRLGSDQQGIAYPWGPPHHIGTAELRVVADTAIRTIEKHQKEAKEKAKENQKER